MQKLKEPIRIHDDIFWVGALNPELKRFDVVMHTEYGTSYNAYIVKGADKTALIDTVKHGFLDESLELIKKLIDPKQIDYIILQHTEPDHSGAIAELLEAAPRARILCSKPASLYLPYIAKRELPIDVVKEGDTLALGGHTLRFISAPFLHWPDTMFTYDENTGTLFTCDAFGCHYAPEHVLESLTDESFKSARRYYYDCIVSPFAPHVSKAIKHVSELKLPAINRILPSHGPVLDKDPLGAIALYDEWAREREPLKGDRVFIGYVTCYGYTGKMAGALENGLKARGLKTDCVNLVDIDAAQAASRMMLCDAALIGTPTVNADSLPPIWRLLSEISVPVVRGRSAAAFGSFGWSGEAVAMVDQRLTGLGYKTLGTVKARFNPDIPALDEIAALADKVADTLQKR